MQRRSTSAGSTAVTDPPRSVVEEAAPEPRRRVSAAALAVTLVLAACSVIYELIAAQTLALLAANTVVWFSVTIGTFLASMGLGALRCERIGEDRDPWRELVRVELLLCLAGLAIVPAIHVGHMLHGWLAFQGHPSAATGVFFGTAFAVTGWVGYLTGIELPLLMRIAVRETGDDTSGNFALGVDYVGSLLGAIAFPLVLLPGMRLIAAGALVAAVNLAVAAWIAWRRLDASRSLTRASGSALALAAGIGVLVLNVDRVEQYFLRKYYYYTHSSTSLSDLFAPMGDFPKVFRARSPYQRIDIMEDVDWDVSQQLIRCYSDKAQDVEFELNRILFLNGDFQTNTTYEEIYHEWFAHVPIVAAGKTPRRVLVLGGGDGFLIRELLKHEGIESILHIDIDPVLPEVARTHPVLSKANAGSFDNPRVTTEIRDGFQFVRTVDERFDAIYIDFPVAVDYDLSRLYSREFFHFVRARLEDDGFAVFDSTGTSLLTRPDADGRQQMTEGNDWPIYANTLVAAGFEQIVPYLTSMEIENEAAQKWLEESGLSVNVGQEFLDAWNAAEEGEEKKALEAILIRSVLAEHVLSLQQGFVMLARQPGLLQKTWRDPGVELHILDQVRFDLSFSADLPIPTRVDPDLVNSVLRPRFPTTPIWDPRKPY